jgi:hypothetical protein
MEGNLEKNITKLIHEGIRVIGVDSFRDLIRLFEEIFTKRLVGLLKVPGTASIRIAKASHDFAQGVDIRRTLLTRKCRDKDRCQVVDRNSIDAYQREGIHTFETRDACGGDDLHGPVIREAGIEESQLDIRCDFLIMNLIQEDWAICAKVWIRIRKCGSQEVGIYDVEVVDNGSLNGFKAGIHKGWRPNNLDRDVFISGAFEENTHCRFADERVTGDSVDNIAACGVRTEYALNDGIIGFFEGAAGLVFVIKGDDVACTTGCKVFSERASFGTRVAFGP